MTVACDEATINLDGDRIHIYTWSDASCVARRIVVLIHGLMMHGRSFEALAGYLAAAGNVVVAPDLRGFGKWYFSPQGDKERISFSKSLEDLSRLFRFLERQYPGLPLFCAGESLGSHFARKAVALHPELVSGLILSSPCMRPRLVSLPLIPHACSELVLSGLDPGRELNLSPFAMQFLKDEPDNLQSYLDDPMSRKSLEVLELIDSLRVGEMGTNDSIPDDLPVLVLRGKNDCVCTDSSMKKFIETLHSSAVTVHHCTGCGHLILQAAEVKGDVLEVIDSWMDGLSVGKSK